MIRVNPACIKSDNCARERPLFGFDPPGHLIAGFDGVVIKTAFEKPTAFFVAQGVTGKNHRHPKQQRQAGRRQTSVRVVAVDDVGHASHDAKMPGNKIDELFNPTPKAFLSQIAAGAEWNPDDEGVFGDLLAGPGVIVVDFWVVDQASQQIDAAHAGISRERFGELDDVGRLAAGVGVGAEFEVFPANQPVETDENDVESIACDGATTGR